ncbi:MAG: PAS domain-containing protein, partial [Candidatus Omnitrophica bacterium]|nr:PAS domain-containing protein [Candidatus Omnitrophota bacterium]
MSFLTLVYIITGVISVGIALLMVYFAGLSAQAKARQENTPVSSDIPPDESLKKEVFSEICNLVESRQQGKEISQKVSAIFSRELEKRVSAQSQELTKKYETAIEQKVKSEEIAWEKYKKVMVDKKQTEAVIRSIAEGLVVVDASGNVMMMNPAAEKLLGVSRKDKIGKPVMQNLRDEQLVSFAKGGPDQEDKDIELISGQSDTKKILRASTAVIENENGKTVGMVSVLSDITKQRELEDLKSKFVASVSHELRTPLVSVEKS